MTHSTELPASLQASNMLVTAIKALPASFPRPESLVSPRTQAELEAWKTQESAHRERLDSAVREWLASGHWPADLDDTDTYLLATRITATIDWLELGRHCAVRESSPTAILQALLIEGWGQAFVEQHCRRLSWGVSSYFCGRESAGTFTE